MSIGKTIFWFIFAGLILSLVSCREDLTSQWELPVFASDARLNAVYFIDSQTGFVAGGKRFEETLLQKSADRGRHWETRYPDPAFDQILFDLEFRDQMRGFATGIGGKILKTLDGGENWQTRQMATWLPLHALAIVNDTLLVAVGGNGYDQGVILRSETFGGIWEGQDTLDFELRDVDFTSTDVGYACGYGVVLKTIDGGKNWAFTDVQGDFFSSIHFPTEQVGFVVGRAGSIFKTRDAGLNWKRLRNGNFLLNAPDAYNAVHFINEQTGYIIGDKGLIIKTVDGGEKWSQLAPYSQSDLHDLHVFREGELIVVGKEGTLLHLFE